MVINDLYEAGCRNIKLDDCTWEMMADKSGHLAYGTTQSGLIEIQKAHKDINNKVIANAPKDIVINTHVCRGNFHSTYANSGAYDPVADILFGEENVNAYYLEFDDERSGGFEPLAKVSGDKKVVLGLITTKSPKLENKEESNKENTRSRKIYSIRQTLLKSSVRIRIMRDRKQAYRRRASGQSLSLLKNS